MSELKKDIEKLKKNQAVFNKNLGDVATATGQLAENFHAVDDQIQAIRKFIGEDKIDALVKELMDSRAMKEKEARLKGFESAVSSGYMIKGGVVNNQSIVCGVEKKADGSNAIKIADGWSGTAYVKLPPQIRAAFDGATEGSVVELMNGHSFELQAIYTLDGAKFIEYAEAHPEEFAAVQG